jgi:hypothetical protein
MSISVCDKKCLIISVLLAAHEAFAELGNENFSRCFRSIPKISLGSILSCVVRRKAALCYIKSGDYGSAQDLIGQCPANEASTQYLSFLVAVQQGASPLSALSLIR